VIWRLLLKSGTLTGENLGAETGPPS